ncbi:hypothetical protein KDAU_04140 [Dictyobacter aurantiacus]|uniref:Uncharacterized protein n=1 Tax=Dictyobacter aurantiacus TaxID=1936993 RepID=A0A401Z8B8_9CHLR|nr:hypothetical protein KDAU_04140 [Dictyobacter aurantiacus]
MCNDIQDQLELALTDERFCLGLEQCMSSKQIWFACDNFLDNKLIKTIRDNFHNCWLQCKTSSYALFNQ